VQRATEPSSVDPGQVAPAASGGRAELPLPPPTRAQLDRSVRCMADHGFGMGSANDRHGTFIPRAETQTPEFRRAAKDCELPPPPTDAQIARIGCAAAQARREGAD
jgi:hypothetical protein